MLSESRIFADDTNDADLCWVSLRSTQPTDFYFSIQEPFMTPSFSYKKEYLEELLPGRFHQAYENMEEQDIGIMLTKVLNMHELVEHILKYNLQLRNIQYPTSGNKGHDILHLYDLFEDKDTENLQSESDILCKGFFNENQKIPLISEICEKHKNCFQFWRYTILSDNRGADGNPKTIHFYELVLLFISAVNISDLSIKFELDIDTQQLLLRS